MFKSTRQNLDGALVLIAWRHIASNSFKSKFEMQMSVNSCLFHRLKFFKTIIVIKNKNAMVVTCNKMFNTSIVQFDLIENKTKIRQTNTNQ